MATLIKQKDIATDPWLLLEDPAAAIPPGRDIVVPLARWLSEREALVAHPDRVGVLLAGDDEPAVIAGDLRLLGVIAVGFPAFTDGRGYSIARLLRERHGWRGELRAVGDIQRDQLFYLARCGFDAFLLRDGEDAVEALKAFSDFTEAYQGAVDQPLPLFRRRVA